MEKTALAIKTLLIANIEDEIDVIVQDNLSVDLAELGESFEPPSPDAAQYFFGYRNIVNHKNFPVIVVIAMEEDRDNWTENFQIEWYVQQRDQGKAARENIRIGTAILNVLIENPYLSSGTDGISTPPNGKYYPEPILQEGMGKSFLRGGLTTIGYLNAELAYQF